MSQPIGACVIVKKDQQILVGKRKNGYKAGLYGLPGGHVELGEEVDQTVKRELLEETSLIAHSLQYVGIVREFQGTADYIHFIYLCENFSGEPQLVEPEKCEGWEWHDLHSMPTDILRGHHAALALYTSGEKMLDITDLS